MDLELNLKISDYVKVKKIEATRREEQKENFDSRHKAHDLPPLYERDDSVDTQSQMFWQSYI